MTAIDNIKAIQLILTESHFYTGAVDGIPGPLTQGAITRCVQDALAEQRNARGRPDAEAPNATHFLLPSKLPWTAEVDGDDLVVRNVKATAFGGAYDAGDNGQTESGIPNRTNPDFLCALPIRSTEAATVDSPLAFKGPHIPWGTKVKVWLDSESEDSAIECTLADNGPRVSEYPDHALDLNPPAALHFAPSSDIRRIANTWSGSGFSYRIIGGAQWIS